jgi:hypothetical protein
VFPHCSILSTLGHILTKDSQSDCSRIGRQGTEFNGILAVRSFRGADYDTDHCLMIAAVREILSVNKRVT